MRLKSSVLSRRLKAISDGDVMTSDGRRFQTRGAAETAKARSPTVTRRVGGTCMSRYCSFLVLSTLIKTVLDQTKVLR